MTEAQLAKMMNVSETDLTGFIAALRHWIGKGMTLNQAIQKNMEVMTHMVSDVSGAVGQINKVEFASAIWEEMRAA